MVLQVLYVSEQKEFERTIKQCLYRAELKFDTELEERVQGGRLFHSLGMRLKKRILKQLLLQIGTNRSSLELLRVGWIIGFGLTKSVTGKL